MGYRLAKREHDEFRQTDGEDERSWDETTASTTRRKYQVPLSKYLETESDVDGSLVTSRERKEGGFREKNQETR